MTEYNFCPKCGNKIAPGPDLPHCSTCDTTYYHNPKPCASVLPIKDGKVLLAKRGVAPYKGSYDIIGGFMDINEQPMDAAIREAKEETGLDVKITSLLGTYVDKYGDDGDYTLSLHYLGEVIGGEMKPMDDVASLEWVTISEVPLNDGLQNTRDGLRDLKKFYENE